jgi:hypothetical protein
MGRHGRRQHYNNTAEGRLKHKNISRDPRIAIGVVDQNNPYHMVTVRGRVVQQTNEGADEHIDKLAKKYLGVDKYPGQKDYPGQKRVIVKIKPESATIINIRQVGQNQPLPKPIHMKAICLGI